MSSSSKFSHHDYPRRRWLIPLWILLLLHHHTFACFDSISTPLQDLISIPTFPFLFIIQSYPNCFSSSFFSHIWLSMSSSLFILLRRRCRLQSHSSCHWFKGYHQLWKGWCESLIMSLVWIVKMNGIQFIATFVSIWYSFLALFMHENIFTFLFSIV